MGRGDSSWQDRHPKKHSSRRKSPSSLPDVPIKDKILAVIKGVTPPTIDTSVGTEGYDDTKATTAVKPPSNPQVGESIMNSGGTGANETYDSSKGSKGTSAPTATTKKRKSNLKVNISGAGGTGRNIV